MNRIIKRIIVIVAGIIALGLIITGVIFIKKHCEPRVVITKATWVNMLEKSDNNPNIDIIGKEKTKADRRFVAMSSMKCLDNEQLQIYLGKDKIKKSDLLVISKDLGYIDGDYNKGITKSEAKSLIHKLNKLRFNNLIKDDYCDINYQNNVKEISKKESKKFDVVNNKGTKLDSSYQNGDIIIIEKDGFKYAKMIANLTDNSCDLTDPKLEDIIDEATISDKTQLAFDDIVTKGEDDSLAQVFDPNDVKPMASASVQNKGFAINLKYQTNDNKIRISVKNNNNNKKLKLPAIKSSFENPMDTTLSATLDVNKIDLAAQIKYSALKGLQYASATIDTNTEFEGKLKCFASKDFELFDAKVPVAFGIVSFDVKILLHFDIEGKASLKAVIPYGQQIIYTPSRGLVKRSLEYKHKEPEVSINVDTNLGPQLKAAVCIFSIKPIINTSIDSAINCTANYKNHPRKLKCLDIKIAFPIITISIGDDTKFHDRTSIINDLGLEKSWNIYTKKNAPVRKTWHYEKKGKSSFEKVAKCSYVKKAGDEEENNYLEIYTPVIKHVYDVYYQSIVEQRTGDGSYYTPIIDTFANEKEFGKFVDPNHYFDDINYDSFNLGVNDFVIENSSYHCGNLGYSFTDLNDDGIKELAIIVENDDVNSGSYSDKDLYRTQLLELYTISNNKPQILHNQVYVRGSSCILENNKILSEGSGGASRYTIEILSMKNNKLNSENAFIFDYDLYGESIVHTKSIYDKVTDSTERISEENMRDIMNSLPNRKELSVDFAFNPIENIAIPENILKCDTWYSAANMKCNGYNCSDNNFAHIDKIEIKKNEIVITARLRKSSSHLSEYDNVEEKKVYTFKLGRNISFYGYNGYLERFDDYSFKDGKNLLLSQNSLEVKFGLYKGKLLAIYFAS